MRGRTWALGVTAAAVVAAGAVVAVLTLGGSSGSRAPLSLKVFARAQTAADRAAFTRRQASLGSRLVPASARVAQTAPWGSPILLVRLAPHRQSISANHPRSVASFVLAWDQSVTATPQSFLPDGVVTESHAGGASVPPPGITAKRIATRIVVVVPNEVAQVRFAYPDGGPAKTVTVHGNVAAVQFAQPCCVLEPEMTWYSEGGSVLRRELTTPGALTRFSD
jgi:hypothetical protein